MDNSRLDFESTDEALTLDRQSMLAASLFLTTSKSIPEFAGTCHTQMLNYFNIKSEGMNKHLLYNTEE